MFLFRRPLAHDVERVLAASRELPLSYDPIGLAQEGRAGFSVEEQITIVGSGEAAFVRATTALIEWRHFELGWVELFPKRASIAPGTVVVVSVQHLGFWSLNGCRVVYSIGMQGDRTFGFAYGTLANHAESGEEIFQVSFRPETGDVSYLIRAVSKPRAALARLGYPLTRSLQAKPKKSLARGSLNRSSDRARRARTTRFACRVVIVATNSGPMRS